MSVIIKLSISLLPYSDAEDSNPDEEDTRNRASPNYSIEDSSSDWVKEHNMKQRLIDKEAERRAKIASDLKENPKLKSSLLQPGP